MKNTDEFSSCAERLRAIADPDRLRIILCLFEGEKNVGQIASTLGDAVVKVSHHLGILRHAHIVSTRRQGRCVNYRLHSNVCVQSAQEGHGRWIEFGCCRVDLTGTEVSHSSATSTG